ncbi:MAG: M28 family peptidase [Acidobacteriia bacterium]|nr:M28 family peptidase [Terriglobia bacterium]
MKLFTAWVVGIVGVMVASAGVAAGQRVPLLAEREVAALHEEISGEAAKRNLEGIARNHRQRGSRGFRAAAELVAERARAYGLSDVQILQFPADGKIFYGTQRSRPAWDAEFAELWEVGKDAASCYDAATKKPQSNEEMRRQLATLLREDCDPRLLNGKLLASYEAMPIVLAEDSESAEVTAGLMDVGSGTAESDYAGKDVKGKIVLVSAQAGAVQELAVGKFGAAGIVSYAQNQRTAWYGEDENLIRWGHLETFSANKTFAFMVSLKTARGLRERLGRGEEIRLHATVKAGQHAGNIEVVTATIPGADAKLKDEEIAFSCHLDHQRPGANDNASGCATILEVARTLQKLINEGKLARPARTIRFIWPPEIEGTTVLLNARPELARRIKAAIHMDMVGGGPVTKAVFHVTRGPMSLPSFVHDVAWAFAEFVNEESYQYAATGKAEFPFVAAEGGKEPLRAEYSAYTMGSDHDVYQDGSFKIPAIYLNDWPDRYIHTNFDTAENIDATKLRRAAFIGAASGYFLAGAGAENRLGTAEAVQTGRLARRSLLERRMAQVPRDEYGVLGFAFADAEREIGLSVMRFFPHLAAGNEKLAPFVAVEQKVIRGGAAASGDGALVFRRVEQPRGPMAVFGYDYFTDHWREKGMAAPKLLSYEGLWGAGEEYAYEALNFADGTRNAREIRDAVSAEYGPVGLEMVVEYLRGLERIGVVELKK